MCISSFAPSLAVSVLCVQVISLLDVFTPAADLDHFEDVYVCFTHSLIHKTLTLTLTHTQLSGVGVDGV